MAEYNIGAVAKLTGITPHNLRVWEKRHQLTPSGRTDSGRRVYSEEDVERLSLIKQCIDLGHSVGNLAALDIPALKHNLAQLSQADASDNTGGREVHNLVVVSDSPYPFDTENLFNHQINLLLKCRLTEELQKLDEPMDILVLESALVTEELISQLTDIKANRTPRLILFIYRIARQDDIKRIRNLGIRTVRAPMEIVEIEDILFRFVDKAKQTTGQPVTQVFDQQPVERKFTLEQLDKLRDRPYNLHCECPRHISEIVRSMEAFENYSLECQHRNDEDAALHAKLFNQTSQARSMMEDILQQVLDTEGLQV